MNERFLEDFAVGQRLETAGYTVTRDEIVAFARQWDPQPFHLDEAAAERSVFKGLAASGWHTAGITMRLTVQGPLRVAGGLVGRGVESLEWPRPVRPGDTLRVESEVLEIRPSATRKDRGTVKVRHETRNQSGDVVQRMVVTLLVPRRVPAG
jgi:acyl dehydratase